MNPTSGVLGEAWELYKTHWRHLLTISFVVYAAASLLGAVLTSALGILGAFLGTILSLIALFWVQGALVRAVEDVRDGRADLSLSETFARTRPQLPAIAVAGILAGIAIGIGLVLLIAPGLLLMTWWAVIIPVIVLENRRAGESFTRSRELVRGNGWNVFGLIILTILILLGVTIVLSLVLSPLTDWLQSFVSSVVNGTVTAPFIALTLTLLYYRLRAARESAAPATG